MGADVVIVGGGFTGLGAAYEALKRGLSTVVIERGEIASGASGRNAGFLLRGAAMSHAALTDLLGAEVAETMLRYSLENRRLLMRLAEEADIDAELRICGSLMLCADNEEEEAMRRSAELLRPLGLELQSADLRGLPRALSGRYQSGFFVPDDGELHPVKWLRGVAAWLMQQGVRIYEHTDVLRIDGRSAVTARGRARGEAVVLAVNAYSGGLVPTSARLARPVRAQVLITDPQPRTLYAPIYARHGYEYYRQTRDGRLLVGGWRDLAPADEVGEDLTLHPKIQAALEAFVRELMPAARVERRWAGIMGFSNDHLPVIRRVSEKVAMVLGFSGHGVALAFRLGGLAVDLLQGDTLPGFLGGERRNL